MAETGNRPLAHDPALATQHAVASAVALDKDPGSPVEADLRLDVEFSGKKHAVVFPREARAIHVLVRALYLALGEDAVHGMFLALRRRVRSFAFEADNAPRLAAKAAKYGPNDKSYGPEYQARTLRKKALGQTLIRHFIAAWEEIVEHEGQFLQWYERTAFRATQALFRDRRAYLDHLWHDIYRVCARSDTAKKVIPLASVLSGDVDLDDLVLNPKQEAEKEALFGKALDLAALWDHYLSEIDSLRQLKGIPVAPQNISAMIENDLRRIEIAHQRYRDEVEKIEATHPLVIGASKKYAEAILRGPVNYQPSDTKKKAKLQRFLLESMTEPYAATASVEKQLREYLIFPEEGTKLAFEPRDEDYFLRPSVASLIGKELEDWGAFYLNVSADALWTQEPLLSRIDQEATQLLSATAPSGNVGNLAGYLSHLGKNALALLGASAALGTLSYRARREVAKYIEREAERSKKTYENAKRAITVGGMSLAWSTGGTSLVVAGALDAAFSIVESGNKFSDYMSSRNRALIVFTAAEDAFWRSPHLCDLVQNVTTTLVNALGNAVTEGAPSHVIDALAMTLSFMDGETQ